MCLNILPALTNSTADAVKMSVVLVFCLCLKLVHLDPYLPMSWLCFLIYKIEQVLYISVSVVIAFGCVKALRD